MKQTARCAAFALFFAFALSVITPERLFADEQSHRKLAEKFMALIDVEKMMAGTFDQLKESQVEKLDVDYPGKTLEKDRVLMARVEDYLDRKLVWSNFKQGYAAVYTDAFTEKELKTLVDFYSSPVGQKVLKNNLDMRIKLLQSTQMELKDMNLALKKIEADFIADQSAQAK